ncbi:MAG: hypothetical protein ACFFBP_04180 [Promethearchaeota archaeon]
MKLKEIFKLEKKYILIYIGFFLSLVIYLFIYIAGILGELHIIQGVVPPEYLNPFVVIIPGPLITDILILYILPIIILIVFLFISPYLILFLTKLHKISFIGRKTPDYGIIELGRKRSIVTLIRRSWTIGFFSFTISAGLVLGLGLGDLFRANIRPDPDIYPLNIAEAIFLGTFFFTFVAFLLALPIWLMEDSGVSFYRKFPDDLRTPTLRGAYRLYEQVVEAYTGITTFLALFDIIVDCFAVLKPGDVAILTPLILIVLPLFVTGLFAIPLIIYEKLLPESVKKVQDKLKQHNYPVISIPDFDDLILK